MWLPAWYYRIFWLTDAFEKILVVGSPGFEFPEAKLLTQPLPGLQVSSAPLQWVIILSSADPQLPLEPTVLAKLHYDPTKLTSLLRTIKAYAATCWTFCRMFNRRGHQTSKW